MTFETKQLNDLRAELWELTHPAGGYRIAFDTAQIVIALRNQIKAPLVK